MTKYKNWKIKLEDQIFWILLDRPQKKNAFSKDTGEELYEILEQDVEGNLDNIRVVVYSSTLDQIMCSGADLTWFQTLNGPKARQASINSQSISSIVRVDEKTRSFFFSCDYKYDL